MRLVVAGSRAFGRAVLIELAERHDVALVVTGEGVDGRGDQMAVEASKRGLFVSFSGSFRAESVPEGVDLIVAAHSHAFISRKARHRVDGAGRNGTGAIGYHPSLLPLHRGRDAVRWTVAMGDRVAGGSVYWLTDNVDAGPIQKQAHVLVDRRWDFHALWREALFPLGVRLLVEACEEIEAGKVVMQPQREELATWEPSWERPPLYRPELPELQ